MQLPILHEIKAQAQQAFYVPNFNPADYLTCYTNNDGSKSYYLEVKYRILWFRYCYPLGRFKVDILHHDEKSIIVSAKIYMDWTVEEHQFLSQGFAHIYKQPDSDFDYVEWAQTKAIGRALAYAGFGQQFCDIIEKPEPEQVDSPVVIMHPQQPSAQNAPSNQPAAQSNQQQSTVVQMTPNQQAQQQRPAYGAEIDFPDEDLPKEIIYNPPVQQPPVNNRQQIPQNQPAQNRQQQTAPPTQSPAQPTNTNGATQSPSIDDYLGVKITFGRNNGQTLGDLYNANDTKSLKWLANTYGGRDKHLKADAQALLSIIQTQAS